MKEIELLVLKFLEEKGAEGAILEEITNHIKSTGIIIENIINEKILAKLEKKDLLKKDISAAVE